MVYKLNEPAFLDDPTALLVQMRAEGPLVRVKLPLVGAIWANTTDEAARRLLKSPDLFRRNPAPITGKSRAPHAHVTGPALPTGYASRTLATLRMIVTNPRLPTRRTRLKLLHWGIVPFFIWFMFADPDALRRMGPGWFQLHSINGLIFVTLALIWTGGHLRQGLASRPGPKLPGVARAIHPLLHKTLIWGLFLVALTGFGLGLTSAVVLRAGGVLPIAPPLNLPQAHAIVSWIHVYQFYALALIVGIHAAFHVWRHVRLRDNALRIMAPKALHRFL